MLKHMLCLIGTTLSMVSAHLGPHMGAQTMRLPTPRSHARGLTEKNDNVLEDYFWTKLDHFDSEGKSSKFKMRYLVNDQYWDPETGPILFYAGNEGDIYEFYYNTGFMTETIAQETKGLIVFGEHRYFGVSYPYDPSVAFTPEHNVYLTVE